MSATSPQPPAACECQHEDGGPSRGLLRWRWDSPLRRRATRTARSVSNWLERYGPRPGVVVLGLGKALEHLGLRPAAYLWLLLALAATLLILWPLAANMVRLAARTVQAFLEGWREGLPTDRATHLPDGTCPCGAPERPHGSSTTLSDRRESSPLRATDDLTDSRAHVVIPQLASQDARERR